jgi:hypothetical protein
MMPPRAIFAAALLCACGCWTSPTPSEATPPTAQLPLTPAVAVTGRWASPSCGARTYERRITLDAAGTFTAEDRISPCPPRTVCVWSGIVTIHGTYTPAGGEIRLTPDRQPARPLPASLTIDPTGALVEVTPEGERCVYARMPD